MPRETVKIIGIPKLKAALADATSKAHAAAVEAVAQETQLIRQDAARTAPHKTGELAAKIHGEAHELEGTVKSTVRYAGFVEHGTYRDKAQPYMAPSADRARLRFPKRAAAIIKAAVGG